MNKTLLTVLYALYGPNGSDQLVNQNQKREFSVYRQLESCGLVKLVPSEHWQWTYKVVRQFIK